MHVCTYCRKHYKCKIVCTVYTIYITYWHNKPFSVILFAWSSSRDIKCSSLVFKLPVCSKLLYPVSALVLWGALTTTPRVAVLSSCAVLVSRASSLMYVIVCASSSFRGVISDGMFNSIFLGRC